MMSSQYLPLPTLASLGKSLAEGQQRHQFKKNLYKQLDTPKVKISTMKNLAICILGHNAGAAPRNLHLTVTVPHDTLDTRAHLVSHV